MKLGFVLPLFISGFIQTEGSLWHTDNKEKFDDAVEDCNDSDLELLTISTYSQYQEAQDYFNSHSVDDSWLALEENTTTGNYQWLNGRVLTELKWESGEPEDTTGTDCGVMDVSSKLWYSLPCSATRHYLCVGSDGYSVGSGSVDFYTAVLNCQSEGKRLPVAITIPDTDWLNDVVNDNSLSNDIWLGLIEYDEYYKWVTGEHLTPPYTWASSSRYDTVHYHHTGGDEGFHSSSTSEREYICQTKSTVTAAVVRSPDKFVFVSNNAMVLGSSRKATTINSLRRFQCAVECLRDTGCVQFTVRGYLCRTFGESLVITDYNGGHMLWQRKIIP